jgi:glutaredoxin/glutathione-dependent peroxiredoxin
MAIQVGDKIPSVKLKHLTDNGMQEIDTGDLFAGKKVVLFSVPGAFTPTCSARHLPGFVQHAEEFKSKGYDIVCVAVNDPFVMEAWGKSAGVDGKVSMLPDGNGSFTRALGLEMDGSGYNLGMRGQRFAIVAEDGVAKQVLVEQPGAFEVSSAENVLQNI